jgi:hypothetical protein
MSAQERRQSLLKLILAASIVSTAAHYSHNYVQVDQYPLGGWLSETAIRAAILVSWPLLTAVGLVGYRQYSRRRYREAHACLLAYSFTGISTLGHFLYGSPDIPPVWYATIFTDGLTGLAVLAFTVWSALTVRADAEATSLGARAAAR